MKSVLKSWWYTWGGWFISALGCAIAIIITTSDIRFSYLLMFVTWIVCGLAYNSWLSSYRAFLISKFIDDMVEILNEYDVEREFQEKKTALPNYRIVVQLNVGNLGMKH